MKTILAIIILTQQLAAVASAQVIYSSVKVAVDTATPCPSAWTRTSETIVSPALFYIHVPASIGGRVFLVTSSLVDALWPSAASKAAAVASGVLAIQAETTTDRFFCSLVP